MKFDTNISRLIWVTVFVAVYAFGWIFPDTWWGTHYLQFLSPGQLIVLSSMIVVLLAIPIKTWDRVVVGKGGGSRVSGAFP